MKEEKTFLYQRTLLGWGELYGVGGVLLAETYDSDAVRHYTFIHLCRFGKLYKPTLQK